MVGGFDVLDCLEHRLPPDPATLGCDADGHTGSFTRRVSRQSHEQDTARAVDPEDQILKVLDSIFDAFFARRGGLEGAEREGQRSWWLFGVLHDLPLYPTEGKATKGENRLEPVWARISCYLGGYSESLCLTMVRRDIEVPFLYLPW